MSELLLHIAPECPLCHVHHPQSFTEHDLSELLERGELTLFCPRLEMSWPAPPEQCDELAREVDSAGALTTACSTVRKRTRPGERGEFAERAIPPVSTISNVR